MRIALDAMGGDYAPGPNIDGTIISLKDNPNLEIVLVGDPSAIDPLIEKSGYNGDRLTVRESDGFIRMDEKPTEALRKKPNCSIALCWKMMAGREVEAVVSAGHTGAMVAAGLRTRLFLKGVKRPGIAVALPTAAGQSVLMDVGANPAARPEHLYQYAVMGEIYAREILGIETPRIGLMNIGSEEGKGNELYRETHKLISDSPLKSSYIGNVEGRGLYMGEADVLICEGFVGNVVLKVSEGMASYLLNNIAQDVVGPLSTEKPIAAQALQNLSYRYQHNESGGAPLLGVDGISIICHGSSDATSITNAVRVATTFENRQINTQITEQLDNLCASKETD